MAYKLVELDGRPVLKLSAGKATLPGRKQVWRHELYDLLGLADERPAEEGAPLLADVMTEGRRTWHEPLEAARARAAEERERLGGADREVRIDAALEQIKPGASSHAIYSNYIRKMDAWGLPTLHFLGHGLGLTLLLLSFGLVSLYSASSVLALRQGLPDTYYVIRQSVGAGVGLVVAVLFAQLLRSELIGVSSFDPLTFGGVLGMLALIALAASWLPAKRALRVQPMEALRQD